MYMTGSEKNFIWRQKKKVLLWYDTVVNFSSSQSADDGLNVITSVLVVSQ
jgi:hypothetical protein